MSYQDNVRAAAAALTRGEEANWELARLTFDSTFASGDLASQKDKVSVAKWSADVRANSERRFAEYTAGTYRRIWQRYGLAPGQDRPSWGDAYAEVRGGTVGERMVEADFKRALSNATPEQKREHFATLSREPEVVSDPTVSTEVFQEIAQRNPQAVEQAMEDHSTRATVNEVNYKHQRAAAESMREAKDATRDIFEPKDTTLDRSAFFSGIQAKLQSWTYELTQLQDFLKLADDVNIITRWSARNDFERLIRAAEICRDMLPASYAEAEAEDIVTSATTRARRKLA